MDSNRNFKFPDVALVNRVHAYNFRAAQSRTFPIRVYAGPGGDANNYIVVRYRNYRVIAAQTFDTLSNARAQAHIWDDDTCAVHILDENGVKQPKNEENK